MSNKTVKAQAVPTNTSVPAQPDFATDVSATEVVDATSQAIAPAADEGIKPDGGSPETPPAGGGAELGTDRTAQSEFTHRIHGKAAKGFYRAGRFWPRDGVDVNRASFTDEAWAVLADEPQLSIVIL